MNDVENILREKQSRLLQLNMYIYEYLLFPFNVR